MTEDRLVRAAVERLLPEERETFFADFWRLTEEREHLAARRWRRTSLAVAAVAVAAIAAAGVIAAPFGSKDVVDRTMICTTQTQAGYHVFDLGAGPTRPRTSSFRQTAQLILSTGGNTYYGTKLLAFDVALKGYAENENLCASSVGHVPLARAGLPLRGEYHRNAYSGREFRCLRPGKIAVHYRLTLGSKGEATRAQVAVQMARTHRPVIYVEWSPGLVRMYGSPACTDSDF